MTEPQVTRFDTRADCEAAFRACLAASHARLEMFDPDFAVYPLGASDVDALLRAFLERGGELRLAMHASAHIERHYPRFLRLLRDYGHRIECRTTDRSLAGLTDSFCIGDGVHIVRRFHSDHMRGEAALDAPAATEVPRERFAAIWEASRPGLAPTTTGL
ncbi:DUF7931 domain-containing protein [Massilia horti]|uniref:DUF7931 domain-containing protein n=1 Tax=Massilia horti TaxID=2562153 RepID=A0A4Y9T6D4_9BURK|nr:hypothetical protein [Massilia horti]TFW36134.1 hypothetical protein E4O92_00065 [Massilia horti]